MKLVSQTTLVTCIVAAVTIMGNTVYAKDEHLRHRSLAGTCYFRNNCTEPVGIRYWGSWGTTPQYIILCPGETSVELPYTGHHIYIIGAKTGYEDDDAATLLCIFLIFPGACQIDAS